MDDYEDGRLALAINHAILACDELTLENIINERTMTGALLGALKTSLNLHSTKNFKFGWSIYNEGREDNDFSEAATGVDFGLIVVLKSGVVRFAVFQAKRPNDVGYRFIRANQTRGEPPNEVSQLLALRDASAALMKQLHPAKEIALRHLKWVHYLAYTNPLVCTPLSRMGDQVEAEEKAAGSSASFDATVNSNELAGVLLSSVFRTSWHWLTIGSIKKSEKIPEFFSRMPIALISGSELGVAPEHFLRSLFDFQPKPHRKLRP